MRFLSVLGGAAAAALFALAGPAEAACQLISRGELDVRFVRNQPLVEASVNGKPVWFLVDTGASMTTIFRPAADRLGLNIYQTDKVFTGVGGTTQGYAARLGAFSLGKASVKDFEVDVAGGANWRGRPIEDRQVVGLLGRNFLAQIDLEFDLQNSKIRLFTPKDCGQQSLAYWTKEPDFVEMERVGKFAPFTFPVKVNNVDVGAILDSGASVTSIDPRAASRAGVDESKYEDKTSKTAGIGNKLATTHFGTFDLIVLGDEQVRRVRLSITPLFSTSEVGTGTRLGGKQWDQMLLGADFLHSHRVYVASSQNRIYFTYIGGPVFSKVSTDPATPPSPTP